MAQTLEHNSTVVSATPLNIPTCEVDTDIIQQLSDEPNDQDGLSAQELKERFDTAATALKDYINDDLIPQIIAEDATEEARAAAEAERVSNEQERVSNENARVSAETARAAAEVARDTAEAARAAAEAARADENAGIVAQASDQAAAAANSAAAALSSENAAATSETSARNSAANAAASASTASSAAATATQKAASASDSATAAGQSARDAAADERAANIFATNALNSALNAESSKNASAASAGDAANSAADADAEATLAASYAIGGTLTREGVSYSWSGEAPEPIYELIAKSEYYITIPGKGEYQFKTDYLGGYPGMGMTAPRAAVDVVAPRNDTRWYGQISVKCGSSTYGPFELKPKTTATDALFNGAVALTAGYYTDVETTGNAKYYAEQSAGSAAQALSSKTAAAASETAAQGSAARAAASATAASESAGEATTSAAAAAGSATAAANSAEAAANSAEAAASSETNAAESADNAAGSATAAAASATAAATSASAAAGSEANAAGSETAAQESADYVAEQMTKWNQKADQTTVNLLVKSVTFNAETGVFTFTREDGSYTTIDTALEKVATNWQYDADTQSLVLTLVDGNTQSVPLSAFITETEFTDSAQIAFSVSNHLVTATIKSGSITEEMISAAFMGTIRNYVSSAAGSASAAATSASAAAGSATGAATNAASAADSAEDSEAWAVGQRGGQDVPSTDETYHNNAKYWSEVAQQAAGGGVTSFNGRTGAVLPQTGDYTAAMVGADPAGSAAAATAVANAAQSTADSKANKGAAFTVTLTAAGWSGGVQTVSDSRFVSAGYAYIVMPLGSDAAVYGAAGVYADNVTIDGQMTFHCAKTPTAALTVNILRQEVAT